MNVYVLEEIGRALVGVFDRVWEHKSPFFVVFFFVFMLSYGILFAVDFVPEAPEAPSEHVLEAEETPASTPVTALPKEGETPNPVRVVIDTIGTDVAVLNPESREIVDLDAALLNGVVRHPDSADFTEVGTMVLFGHSSHLPTVHNKNFQAFNDIEKLSWGDLILVESNDTEYTYRVRKVYKALASEAEVPLQHERSLLVLVTCNSFGSKDDRYVVEAELIEETAL